MILSLACTQLRMTPAEAIVAATINAAYSCGAIGKSESLEAGKQAILQFLMWKIIGRFPTTLA